MDGFISLDTFKSLYTSNPIYIFDTNIYLDLLRYSKETSRNLLLMYANLQDKIWVPNQVRYEFEKNITSVEQKRLSNAKKSITEMKNAINLCNDAVIKQMNFFIKYKFNQANETTSKITSDLNSIKKIIELYGENYILDNSSGFLNKEVVIEFFNSVSLSNLEKISQNDLFNIYKDGDLRYKYKIPPGYMDDPKNNSNSQKDGVEIFGDLVMWNEIMKYGRDINNPIIFVTSDTKEDWFRLKKKKPVAPREELLKEYSEQTDGNQICIITSEKFVEYIGDVLQIDNARVLAEMQKDEFVDIAISDNKNAIKSKLIEWLNKEENINLIPLNYDINKVTNIDDLTLITQDVTADIQSCVYYTALLQGTAKFEVGHYDSNIKRMLLSSESEEFAFSINISFKRKIEHESSLGHIFSNKIYDINIFSGIFEKCDLNDVSIESKRGTFINPNKHDEEIYNYMRKNWGKYDEKNSIERAEALMYIDATNYFKSSLLEINRSFSLVQNQECHINLSLNEIDTLALRRFKDIGFIVKNNICTYDNNEVELGTAYESSNTNGILSPENGKEIEVEFTYVVSRPQSKYIKIEGATNLPEHTELMITINNKKINYRASSNSKVLDSGKFESEIFTRGLDSSSNAMPSGRYELDIVVPIVSVQPDTVKIKFGKNGRNLIGKYVSNDEIMGKTIFFSDILEI